MTTRRALLGCLGLAGGAYLLRRPILGLAATGAHDLGRLRNALQRGRAYLHTTPAEGIPCHFVRTGAPTKVDGKGIVFVAHFLALAVGDLLTEVQRHRLRVRIRRLQTDGPWGYSVDSPVDADDTAFALRTLRLLGEESDSDSMLAGLRGLESFRDAATGLYATFGRNPTGLRIVRVGTAAENAQAHPEVNANIHSLLQELGASRPAELMGLWGKCQSVEAARAFYYPASLYSLFWLLPAVHRIAPADPKLASVLGEIERAQRADGSWSGQVVNTALAIALLGALPDFSGTQVERAQRGGIWLAASQQPDGSWRPEEPIWTHPHPSGDEEQAVDKQGVVSTALVVFGLEHTLRYWQRAERAAQASLTRSVYAGRARC